MEFLTRDLLLQLTIGSLFAGDLGNQVLHLGLERLNFARVRTAFRTRVATGVATQTGIAAGYTSPRGQARLAGVSR